MMDSARRNHSRDRGFSLLEAVLSLVLLSIVMVSVGSAMVFASHATPSADSPVAIRIADHALLARMADDLAQAMYITEQSPLAITVVVPDRTGDGIPDRIRYAWGGTSGDALTYTINGHPEVNVNGAMGSYAMTYSQGTTVQVVPGVATNQSEQEVDSFTNTLLTSQFNIEPTVWCGQVLSINLGSQYSGFTPTKVNLYLGTSSNTDGRIYITIRDWNGTKPGSTIYGHAALNESAMAKSGGWINATLSARQVIPAGQAVVLTMIHSAGTGVMAKADINTSARGGFLTSTNSGSTWTQSTLQSLCFRLYGEPQQQASAYQVTQTHTDAIRIALRSSGGSYTAQRLIKLPTAPVTADHFWHTDYDADPTLMDLDGDGVRDWTSPSASFDVNALNAGVWQIDQPCQTLPEGHFNGVVTVQARLRSNSVDGPALFGPFSATGSSLLPLITQLRQDGSGGQELLFYNDVSMATPVAHVPSLGQGWIDLRLVLLTSENAVMIEVDGSVVGTLALSRVDNTSEPRLLTVRSDSVDAEIDYIRVRVGGSYQPSNETDGLLGGVFNLMGL